MENYLKKVLRKKRVKLLPMLSSVQLEQGGWTAVQKGHMTVNIEIIKHSKN